jgi:hypothetical protein
MNIGILTFHWANNYGAVLQAYGLATALREMGHSPKFIDYSPPGHRLNWWQGWGFKSGKELPSRTLWRFRFEFFRRHYLPTTRPCRSKKDLQTLSREFDAIIVGSDQVWNGHISDSFEPAYFLDFVKHQGCRRISYAACFGDPVQPYETLCHAKELLSHFNAISVRNDMSAEIVESLVGKRPEVVLDPTLLCDYSEFERSQKYNKGYIAVYYLAHPHLSLGLDVLKKIKERLKLPLVSIGLESHAKWAEQRALSAGPVQWMRILKGASFICTNSFHASIFATKFKKPFLVWSKEIENGGFRGPVRIKEFLNLCGLGNRVISSIDDENLIHLIEEDIDYVAVSQRIAPHKIRSLAFLRQAISN